MSEMLERVAKAICVADDGGNADAIFASKGHSGDCTKENWTCPVCQIEEYTKLAKAAIEAMLEPTDEMYNNLVDSNKWAEPEPHSFYIDPADAWRAMITTALGETNE